MKKISDRLAGAIVRRGGREDADIEVISYGLQCTLITMLEFVLIIVFAALFGMLKEILVISAVFVTVRHVAGGVHFSTFVRCLVSSVLFIISGGFIARFALELPTVAGGAYLAAGAVLAGYSVVRYAPRENPNRPIGKKERRKFRTASLVLVEAILAAIVLDLWLKGFALWYHFSLVTGLWLEGFTLTNSGSRLIGFIENRIDKRGGVKHEKS